MFKTIEKDNIKQAIVISEVTFGVGHIVNLFTGHGTIETLLQVIMAIVIGFAFVMFFYKSKIIIPCIITHSLINIASTFSVANAWSSYPFLKYVPGIILKINRRCRWIS